MSNHMIDSTPDLAATNGSGRVFSQARPPVGQPLASNYVEITGNQTFFENLAYQLDQQLDQNVQNEAQLLAYREDLERNLADLAASTQYLHSAKQTLSEYEAAQRELTRLAGLEQSLITTVDSLAQQLLAAQHELAQLDTQLGPTARNGASQVSQASPPTAVAATTPFKSRNDQELAWRPPERRLSSPTGTGPTGQPINTLPTLSTPASTLREDENYQEAGEMADEDEEEEEEEDNAESSEAGEENDSSASNSERLVPPLVFPSFSQSAAPTLRESELNTRTLPGGATAVTAAPPGSGAVKFEFPKIQPQSQPQAQAQTPKPGRRQSAQGSAPF